MNTCLGSWFGILHRCHTLGLHQSTPKRRSHLHYAKYITVYVQQMGFHKMMNMHRISLDGKIIEDAIVIENGLQEYFGLDPQTIFEQAQQVPMQDPTRDIPISESGMNPIMVPGTHPGLHYRGHKLKRHKIWLQTEYKKGLKKYRYSGWQNAIASATRDVESVPAIANVLRQLNFRREQMLIELGLSAGSSKPFNHTPLVVSSKRDPPSGIYFFGSRGHSCTSRLLVRRFCW